MGTINPGYSRLPPPSLSGPRYGRRENPQNIVPRPIIVPLIIPLIVPELCVVIAARIVVSEVRIQNDGPPEFVTGAAIRPYTVRFKERCYLAYPLPEGAAGLRPGLIV